MSRHDFVSCGCTAGTYSDGGGAYMRAGGRPALEEDGALVIIEKESDTPQKGSAW